MPSKKPLGLTDDADREFDRLCNEFHDNFAKTAARTAKNRGSDCIDRTDVNYGYSVILRPHRVPWYRDIGGTMFSWIGGGVAGAYGVNVLSGATPNLDSGVMHITIGAICIIAGEALRRIRPQ